MRKSAASKIQRIDQFSNGDMDYHESGYYCRFCEAEEVIKTLEYKLGRATELVSALLRDTTKE